MKKILLFLLIAPMSVGAQIITTIAGTHMMGYTGNGYPATIASIYEPNQIAVDGSGNVYIAETGNNVVRKVSSSTGLISLVAGTHTAGFGGDGAQATDAKLNQPLSVCLDAAGNIYIAELGNNRVRKINTSGIISTVAGNGRAGYTGDGCLADTTSLNGPFAVAISPAGELVIADGYNNRIRKVDASGIITSIAGYGVGTHTGDGGPATRAGLNLPIDLAYDRDGNLLFADFANNDIRRISAAGMMSTIVGTGHAGYSGDGGPASIASLDYPYALCTDTAGNIYITDNGNAAIRKVNAAGIIETIAGDGNPGFRGDGGPATAAQFSNPGGVKTDGEGNIYIADFGNNVIRKINNWALGIKTNQTGAANIALYPNPATTILTVSAPNTINRITITNLAGATVYDHEYAAKQVQVPVGTLPPGLYFVQVNGAAVKRFVKE